MEPCHVATSLKQSVNVFIFAFTVTVYIENMALNMKYMHSVLLPSQQSVEEC